MSPDMSPPETPHHAAASAAADPEVERALHQTLTRIWSDRPGLVGWLASVNHKDIALRYIVTTFVFFLLGGIEAGLMRAQLARAESNFIGPDLYNQLFTTHGTTMMFLFGVPMVEAIGLYFVPVMVGTRNVAFPRLNALGYWTFLIGGILLYAGLLTNTGPDAGWFAYTPLSGPQYSPGKRVDVWAQMITFTEIAAIISAIEIIATALKHRAPGMSLNRVPLFVWSMVIMSFMVLFAMPVVATDSMMLAFDRLVGTHFFNAAEGGDPVLWQHLFWFFAHPEVYIIFLPSLGIVSAVLATMCRRPVFGYTAVVLSMVATGFLSFGLWVHHMFAQPLPQVGQSFYTAASGLIALPTGVQLFCWIATIWSGRPRFHTPFLFVLGFFFIFVIGGVTGVMLASVPFDLQLTDTQWLPAHIHYVLLGGFVFPLMAGAYFWFPKITGRMLSERMGKWSFALLFAGVNLTFFPMFLSALHGMPRRVYTYPDEMGWQTLQATASFGYLWLFAGVLLFLVNVATSLRKGRIAGADPWGGETLEWAIASPAPPFNFARIPVVQGRSALWDAGEVMPAVHGMRDDRRELLCTTVLDALPDVRQHQPGSTLTPLLAGLAIGVTFVGGIFTPWAFVVGPALLVLPLLRWGWPHGPKHPDSDEIVEVPS